MEDGTSLTINGNGTLYCTGGYKSAGIGAESTNEGAGKVGSINIESGIIIASGGENAAGIGGCENGQSGTISISGGEIVAVGGARGAGIGGGDNATGGIITISGGDVVATGGDYSAGIGGGENSDAGSITITGGNIYASYAGEFAAGIGGGSNGNSGNIVISGGNVYAKGDSAAYDIGPGRNGNGGSITVTGTSAVFLENDSLYQNGFTNIDHNHEPGVLLSGPNLTGAINTYGLTDLYFKDYWEDAQGGYFVGTDYLVLFYHPNSGTGFDYLRTSDGAEIILSSGSGFSKTGYTLQGWSETSGTNTVDYTLGQTFTMPSENTVLYAVWAPTDYTITYNLDAGKNNLRNPRSYNIESPTITFSNPTKSGYTFGGWYTDPDLTNPITEIPLGSTGDVEVWAKWIPLGYNIIYNLDGGTNSPENPVAYNSETPTITFADASKSGYIFEGWYTEAELINPITEIPQGATGDVEVWAKWTADINTISYDNNGGTGTIEDTSGATDSIVALSDGNGFTRTGYSLASWNTSDDGSGTSYTLGSSITMPPVDVTLYAIWAPFGYNIIYHLNGGINNPSNPLTYYIETPTITFVNPSKTGYTFGGWYTDAELTNAITQIPQGSTGDVDVWAKWTANINHISYNNAGGTGFIADTTGATDSTVTLSNGSGFSRNGYTLTGWNTKSDGSGKDFGLAASVSMPSTNITLYAVWTANPYILSYDPNGGTGTITDTIARTDSNVILSDGSGFSRDLFTLAGWSTVAGNNSVEYLLGEVYKMPAKDVTLYAVWEIREDITATLDIQGTVKDENGNPIAGVTVVLNSTPKTTTTNSEGWYYFNDVSIETHYLTFRNGTEEIGRFTIDLQPASLDYVDVSDDGSSGSRNGYVEVGANSVDLTLELNVVVNENDELVIDGGDIITPDEGNNTIIKVSNNPVTSATSELLYYIRAKINRENIIPSLTIIITVIIINLLFISAILMLRKRKTYR
ncbi:InlB B-repeat-containing protein [Eubacteriaceae bacterium ES3]|nr:InlB B-repeat-containing protein [Eubacteriaceae bacterium ES3]